MKSMPSAPAWFDRWIAVELVSVAKPVRSLCWSGAPHRVNPIVWLGGRATVDVVRPLEVARPVAAREHGVGRQLGERLRDRESSSPEIQCTAEVGRHRGATSFEKNVRDPAR